MTTDAGLCGRYVCLLLAVPDWVYLNLRLYILSIGLWSAKHSCLKRKLVCKWHVISQNQCSRCTNIP